MEIIHALKDLGYLLKQTGNLQRARVIFEEDMQIATTYGKPISIASAFSNLSMLAEAQGDLTAAADWYNKAFTLARQVGSQEGMAVLLANLGIIAKKQGQVTQARAFLQDSLQIAWSWRYPLIMVSCLLILADIAGALEEYERLARLLGTAEAMSESLGMAQPPETIDEEVLQAARQRLGEEAWSTAFVIGRRTTPDAAVEAILRWGK